MRIGVKIHRIKSCPSTNDAAKELAMAGGKEGTVIISEEQTRGKGTRGRSWYSARKKGIYLSVILHPSRPNISLLPLMAGLAVNEAIFSTLDIRTKLKWPNDIIWGKEKLGGILCESGFLGNRINFVILGIGLNVDHGKDDFPDEIRHQATSLTLITKRKVSEDLLLQNLWRTLNFWYSLFRDGEGREIVRVFQQNSVLSLEEETTLITEKGEMTGIYKGLDPQGGLILESQGEKRTFFSAEIKTTKDE